MLSGHSNSAPSPTTKGRSGGVFKAGFAVLLVIAAAGVWYFRFSQPSAATTQDPLSRSSEIESGNPSPDAMKPKEKLEDEARPYLELQKIIQFGRTLELVGRAEAGSKLAVNNEVIEISGDGSFKHFTKPFPASGGRVRLEIKATDLAGRTRILTAFHNFNSSGEIK